MKISSFSGAKSKNSNGLSFERHPYGYQICAKKNVIKHLFNLQLGNIFVPKQQDIENTSQKYWVNV